MITTDRLHQLFHLGGLQNSQEEKGCAARSELSQGCRPASFFSPSVLLPSFYAGLTILQGLIPDRMNSRLSFENKFKSSSLRFWQMYWFAKTKSCRPETVIFSPSWDLEGLGQGRIREIPYDFPLNLQVTSLPFVTCFSEDTHRP